MIDWLLDPHWPYWVTVLLCAIMVALAAKAALATRKRKRNLSWYLGGMAVLGAIIGLTTIYREFPPISPIITALALLMIAALWELGVEQVEPVEMLSKAELERLISQGIRGPRVQLGNAEYELTERFVQLLHEHTGRPVDAEWQAILARLASQARAERQNQA